MTPRDPKHPGSAGRGASSKVLRTYDAFISYAHDDHQAGVVSELHRRLERFAKPWWKARDMQVYRDRTAMGAAPDLWDTIVDAMTVSGWMIVIASPGANRSSWVNREIEWWLAHKPDRPPILALVDGNLAWSARDGGWGPGEERRAAARLDPQLLR
ncbi:MAG TPA: toll/interleukin-1 receptor domain-containing protein [Pseudonocardia sp.]|nr:toll/interleukin-1 receptor domain-containing protein [Pseudonocardia sp.]